MNIRTAEQYLTRYRRIGVKRAPRTRHADIGPAARFTIGDYAFAVAHMGVREKQQLTGRIFDHAFRSRPNHAARAVALPLTPIAPKRIRQPVHPATAPMAAADRVHVYSAQTGDGWLTDRQSRRYWHKYNRALGRADA